MGEKNPRVAFGLLVCLGWLGAHRFYLQRMASAVGLLLLSFCTLALFIWGGGYARFAPYLIAPIFFWLLHDGFWLHDYFRVLDETDSGFADAPDSRPARQPAVAPVQPIIGSTQPSPKTVQQEKSIQGRVAAKSMVEVALHADEAEGRKKARAIKLAKRQIAKSLQENHPQAAHVAGQRLVKYLQQRSRSPQHDPSLAEAYLLQGAVLYQTQYPEAARKKLQMGVHLGAAFAHLSEQVAQAQGWLDLLHNSNEPAQPGQYEVLMQSGDWQQASEMCEQTIALRESAKTVDAPDLAQHHLNAAEIASKLGKIGQVRRHAQAVLVLAQRNKGDEKRQIPPGVQRQALERLGDIEHNEGRYPAANSHYRDALALAATHQASAVEICSLLQRLALNFEKAGDLEKAQGCWSRAADYIAQLAEPGGDSEAFSDMLTRYAAFSARHQPAQVKPLIEQSLKLQQRAFRGYSLAAARAYEVFASFMKDIGQSDAYVQYLRQALLLYQVCDPDNLPHMAVLKKQIALAIALAAEAGSTTAAQASNSAESL